ncbi:AI-2E family transporter [bacterium]|jgi:predicted PurR-regulated permease PerM|nr:AI-2E family transporter [bacterium]
MSRYNVSNFTPFQKLILWTVVIVLTVIISIQLKNLVMPFVFSFVLAYLLNPMVDRLEFVFKNRIIAITSLYIIFFSSVGFAIVFLVPVLTSEINELSREMPVYLEYIQNLVVDLKNRLQTDYPILKQFEVIDAVQIQVQRLLIGGAKALPNLLLSVFSVVTYLAMVPIILFFFLYQGHEMKQSILKIIPNKYFEQLVYSLYKIGSKLGNYLRGILIETLIVGILCILFLFLFGVEYALLLAVVAGIVNIIPYLGPIIGAIPALVVFYFQTTSVESVFYLALTFVVVQLFDNMILKPVIYSQSVDLHPLLVFVSLIIGGMFAGVWGLILAVPIAGILSVLFGLLYREIHYRMTTSI